MEQMSDEGDITTLFDVLEVLEGVLKHCDPDKRKALADKLDAYQEDFPDDFYWAVGVQSPAMLHHLMMTIDMACRENGGTKRNVVLRLVRKPEDESSH
jgi:hypothetical protein